MGQQLSGGINEMPGARGVGHADDGAGGAPAAPRRREGVRGAVRDAAGRDGTGSRSRTGAGAALPAEAPIRIVRAAGAAPPRTAGSA